jgi:hypothetical protein
VIGRSKLPGRKGFLAANPRQGGTGLREGTRIQIEGTGDRVQVWRASEQVWMGRAGEAVTGGYEGKRFRSVKMDFPPLQALLQHLGA